MFPAGLTHRCKTWLIGLSALALVAIALPHHHGASSLAHPDSACRACRIQEGFAATPAAPSAVVAQPRVIAAYRPRPVQAPRVTVFFRLSPPRAPPASS